MTHEPTKLPPEALEQGVEIGGIFRGLRRAIDFQFSDPLPRYLCLVWDERPVSFNTVRNDLSRMESGAYFSQLWKRYHSPDNKQPLGTLTLLEWRIAHAFASTGVRDSAYHEVVSRIRLIQPLFVCKKSTVPKYDSGLSLEDNIARLEQLFKWENT